MFQRLYNNIWFYAGFDVFHESGIKYLLPDLSAKRKSELLYAFGPISGKDIFLVRQQLHGTVTDVDQIDQHFNPFAAPHHIAAKRPECFLLIVACLNIPAKWVQKQWDIFHPVTAGLIQWCFFLPCTENLQFFWKNRTENRRFLPCSFSVAVT